MDKIARYIEIHSSRVKYSVKTSEVKTITVRTAERRVIYGESLSSLKVNGQPLYVEFHVIQGFLADEGALLPFLLGRSSEDLRCRNSLDLP